MKRVLVIGYGRFGKLLCEIIKKDFEVSVFELNKIKNKKAQDNGLGIINNLDDLDDFKYLFICVPISEFKNIILLIRDKLNPNQILFDVCSVKTYPAEMMTKYVKSAQLIATHPLFGPDSFYKSLGLQIVVCNLRTRNSYYLEFLNYLKNYNLEVIETTPLNHDHDIIYSQAFTYIILDLIKNINFPKIHITTPSYLKLKEITAISMNDSRQLFHDMLFYNPYFKTFYKKLVKGYNLSLKRLKDIDEGG